jgi:hypothetical protein
LLGGFHLAGLLMEKCGWRSIPSDERLHHRGQPLN